MSNDINLNEVIAQIVPDAQVIANITPNAEINVQIIGSGPKGDKGDTPIRGVDYFTQNDISEFLSNVVQDKTYRHPQIQASSSWIIVHNLDKYPSVTIVDSANNVVMGEIE